MARAGAARMAQNTHRMELILMFEKRNCSLFMLGFEPATYLFGRFYRAGITEKFSSIFFEKR